LLLGVGFIQKSRDGKRKEGRLQNRVPMKIIVRAMSRCIVGVSRVGSGSLQVYKIIEEKPNTLTCIAYSAQNLSLSHAPTAAPRPRQKGVPLKIYD